MTLIRDYLTTLMTSVRWDVLKIRRLKPSFFIYKQLMQALSIM